MDDEFQFYDSPIKRIAGIVALLVYADSFNSMIVRLKDIKSINNMLREKWFQFYDSPIKRKLIPHNGRAFGGFNSMIVRLKDGSTLLARCDNMLFQFYDSPIKSCVVIRGMARLCGVFQFYDSPIKR